MKKLITLAFSIIFTMTAFGQRLEYEKSSNWFFGLNAGATWNTTDVQNKTYAGWGFLLGRSFNYDYGRRISYDLRMRYLRGKWYGQDTDSTNLGHLGDAYNGALSPYKDGLGYTVNNYEANVHELGLELAIHFNRFRDRTGWDPYIFGGANISWNETYGDLINQDVFLAGDSATYAYDQIDMTKPAIEFALDENYETALDGTPSNRFNVNFMPSLGVGIGYDFGPRFQVGVEHKTTFALKDDFDGYVDAEPNWGFLKNDVYHYTSAFLRWRFRGGEGHTRPIQPQPNNPTTSGIANAPCQRPDVRVIRPLQRTETVQAMSYVYKAEVRYVQSRNDIVMRVNGVETTNFLYNPQTHQLESYLYLQPGNNTIEVTGRNTCGTDTETSTLIYNDCIDPVVYFENVCSSTFTAQADQRSYTVEAQISNATSIEFTVNGVRSTNFTYNSATGNFRSNILLNDGQNTIRITAVNGCGTDTGTSVVTYTNCPDPIVNFANGNNGFVSVSQANFNLNAYLYNVTSQNNIKVRLNGSNRNFNFNSGTGLLSASLMLSPGQNTIVITATTNCGSDTETLTIDYTPCVNPAIQMVQPIGQSTTTTNGTQFIQASVFNVANVNQIQLIVNGNLQQGGSYNPVTNMFEANVALNPGINTIQITVLNDCGTAAETISVNYNPCVAPDVQMILPASNGGLTSSPSQLVQAIVFNASNISEIQTYVNGTLQNGGTYDLSSGLYQNNVALTLGINTIQVVATNSCGSDVQTVTITYRACEAPQITMTSPTANPFFTSATNLDVTAMIGSVTSTSQVQVTVNGVVDASGASYNSASITYSNNVNLNAGNNTIVITATNSCGTVSEQISVVREVIDIPVETIDSITICFVHSNNVGDPVTMSIPLSQWPTYQSQGAQLGPCPIVNEPVDLPMTICYKTGNNPPMTMQILTSEWPAYEALGATQGPCPEPTMTICFNGNELTVPASQWSTYQAQGATEGPCPIEQEETIIICHTPPGNPSNTQQLEIPLSAWPAHQAHGDVLGPCPTVDPDMVICLNGAEQTILTSEWATYQSQGATQGPCPVDEPMQICMDGTEQTILTSQWPTYQAQGATQGPCPVENNEEPSGIRFNPGNSEWQFCLITPSGTYNRDDLASNPLFTYSGSASSLFFKPIAGGGQALVNGQPFNILPGNYYLFQGNLTVTVSSQQPGSMGQWAIFIESDSQPTYGNGNNRPTSPCESVGNGNGNGGGNGNGNSGGNGNNGNNGGNGNNGNNGNNGGGNNGGGNTGCMPTVSGTFSSDDLNATANSTKDLSNVVLQFFDGTTQKFEGLSGYSATFSGTGEHQGKCITGMWIKSGCNSSEDGPGYGEYVANAGYSGQCTNTPDPDMTICLNGTEQTILTSQWPTYQAQGATQGPCPVEEETIVICANGTEMTIPVSQWATYQAEGATLGPCPTVDPDMTICLNGTEMTIATSEWSKYQSQGATQGPCPSHPDPSITICMSVNGVPTTMTILTSEWPTYQAQGATQGPCPATDPQMTICLNGNTRTILVSEWAKYQSKGATIGPCADAKMTICYNGRTIEIETGDWSRYQTLGATAGACIDTPIDTEVEVGNQGIGNSDTLNGNIQRPTNGGGNEDELLFGNRTITICHTPNGSIASQTIQVPLSEWERYQSLGATLGPCTGSVNSGGGGEIDVNNTGTGNGDGVGNVPINPNGNGGTEPGGGNMPTVGNGSQEANEELIRQQKEEAARIKAEQEEAARKAEEAKKKAAREAAEKERQIQLKKEAAEKKAAELKAQEAAKRKAAQEAAAERARQEKAAKDAAAQKAAKEDAARRQAEEAKRKAAAEKARQEKAAKDAAAQKAAKEEAARRQAEEAKRKAAQEAAAAKARQEKAAKDAAAQKAAREAEAQRQAEAAKRKAAQEAEARRKAEEAKRKAAQEKAAREAEARRKAQEAAAAKARQEKAAREAEARRKAEEAKRKAAQEAAARKKAQEAAAAKARQEKAAREAAAKKAAQEKAAREAAAKKKAEEAARKKAEEQRKAKEREGGR